jgi:hypothetical protein
VNDTYNARFFGMCDELPIEYNLHNNQALDVGDLAQNM